MQARPLANQPKEFSVDTTLEIFEFDLKAYHQMLFRVRGAQDKAAKRLSDSGYLAEAREFVDAMAELQGFLDEMVSAVGYMTLQLAEDNERRGN
jgi:hypothetical protein